MSFISTEDRVESLEKLFAQFLSTITVIEKRADLRDQHAENRMARLESEMLVFKDEMSEFKNEMGSFKDESRKELREMAKQWSDIANKMGTIVEDVLAPNLRRIAKEHFGVTTPLSFSIRHKRSHPVDRSREEEFDTVVISENLVIIGEAKSTVRANDPKEFAEKLARFVEFFPECAGKRIVGVLGSWGIDPSLVKPLTKLRIYAMCMGDETMELVNAEGVEHSSKERRH